MPRFSAYKSLFKISGWDEWKVIFLHSKEKSGGILCGFRAFLIPPVRKKGPFRRCAWRFCIGSQAHTREPTGKNALHGSIFQNFKAACTTLCKLLSCLLVYHWYSFVFEVDVSKEGVV